MSIELTSEEMLISVLMDVMLELRLEVTQRALEEVGDLIDVVSCSDDICDARGCMLSSEMYNEFIKSRHSRYFSTLLQKSCHKKQEISADFELKNVF